MRINPAMKDISQQELFQNALRCYLSTLVSIAKSMEEICPQIGATYQERLLRLPRRLGFEATPRSLEESRRALEANLRSFAERTGQYIRGGPARADQLIGMVRSASDALALQAAAPLLVLESLADQLEAAAEIDDDKTLRALVVQQVVGLKGSVQRLHRDVLEVVSQLRKQAGGLETDVRLSEMVLTVDSLTGLLNRFGLEREIKGLIESEAAFSFLLLEWGNLGPDLPETTKEQVIKHIGSAIVDQVRPNDIVCRWREDKFIVVFDCPMESVFARSNQITHAISDKYPVKVDGVERKIGVTMKATMTQTVQGETAQQFVHRVDELLGHTREAAVPVAVPA
jgi:GGDEF domain-containing protein